MGPQLCFDSGGETETVSVLAEIRTWIRVDCRDGSFPNFAPCWGEVWHKLLVCGEMTVLFLSSISAFVDKNEIKITSNIFPRTCTNFTALRVEKAVNVDLPFRPGKVILSDWAGSKIGRKWVKLIYSMLKICIVSLSLEFPPSIGVERRPLLWFKRGRVSFWSVTLRTSD